MSIPPSTEPRQYSIPQEQAGQRLDVFLTQALSDISRSQLRKAIDAGAALVNRRPAKASYHLHAGDVIDFTPLAPPRAAEPGENIPLELLFEDECLVVVNKPPGLVVHPGKGNWNGTLAAALAFHFGRLSTLGGAARPGIVHRLDRDTSGVILVAKTDAAHAALAQQFADRTVEKEYLAIVVGTPDRDRDLIDLPIGPHPQQRDKKAVRRDHPDARPARTMYEVAERFAGFAAVRAFPKTGRTHQVRIHLAAIGCPVLCDRLYGGRAKITLGEVMGVPGVGSRGTSESAPRGKGARREEGRGRREEGRGNGIDHVEDDPNSVLLDRQALHARRIRFTHPRSGEPLEFIAPLPADISGALEALRRYR